MATTHLRAEDPARDVVERRGSNIATAAIANRLARMVWRVWRDDRPFVVGGARRHVGITLPRSIFPRRTAASTDGTPVRPARGPVDESVAVRGRSYD